MKHPVLPSLPCNPNLESIPGLGVEKHDNRGVGWEPPPPPLTPLIISGRFSNASWGGKRGGRQVDNRSQYIPRVEGGRAPVYYRTRGSTLKVNIDFHDCTGYSGRIFDLFEVLKSPLSPRSETSRRKWAF